MRTPHRSVPLPETRVKRPHRQKPPRPLRRHRERCLRRAETSGMESELRVSARPELTRPVLVAAFRGWNDGAQAASLAGGYLARLWGADEIADIDPDGFFDFHAH